MCTELTFVLLKLEYSGINLLLNMEKSHYHSQRAGEWSLILAHVSRPIYRALTYIAVPLLGPHQPRYYPVVYYDVLPPDRGIRDRKVSLHSMVLLRFYSETEKYISHPHTTTIQEQVPHSLLNRVTSDPRAQTNAFHLRRLHICQNALANTFWPA